MTSFLQSYVWGSPIMVGGVASLQSIGGATDGILCNGDGTYVVGFSSPVEYDPAIDPLLYFSRELTFPQELLQDGDLSTGCAGGIWDCINSTTITAGVATIPSGSRLEQAMYLVPGETYTVTVDKEVNGGFAQVSLGEVAYALDTAAGTYEFELVCGNSADTALVFSIIIGTLTINSVSVVGTKVSQKTLIHTAGPTLPTSNVEYDVTWDTLINPVLSGEVFKAVYTNHYQYRAPSNLLNTVNNNTASAITVGTQWTDNGDGTYTSSGAVDGTDNSRLYTTQSTSGLISGKAYDVTIEVVSVTSGTYNIELGGTLGAAKSDTGFVTESIAYTKVAQDKLGVYANSCVMTVRMSVADDATSPVCMAGELFIGNQKTTITNCEDPTTAIAGGIERSSVVVVYNTSIPESEVIADYYIKRRLLNPSNKFGYAFGTNVTSSWDFDGNDAVNTLLIPLAAKLDAVGAQAVLMSGFTPFYTNTGVTRSLSGLLGFSQFFANTKKATAHPVQGHPESYKWSRDVASTFYTFDYPQIAPYMTVQQQLNDKGIIPAEVSFDMYRFAADDVLPNPYYCLHGRIGTLTADGFTETVVQDMRIIDDAILNEKTIAQAVSEGALIHLGAHDRTENTITGFQAGQARAHMILAGLVSNIKWYELNYNAGYAIQPVPAYLTEDMMGTAMQNGCDVGIGNLTPAQDLWGHLDQSICNALPFAAGTANTWPESYNFLPGAWGIYPTSIGRYPMTSLLLNGGVAAIGTPVEPLGDLPEIQCCTTEILAGKTMAEVCMFGGGFGAGLTMVLGDPLYAPFGKE